MRVVRDRSPLISVLRVHRGSKSRTHSLDFAALPEHEITGRPIGHRSTNGAFRHVNMPGSDKLPGLVMHDQLGGICATPAPPCRRCSIAHRRLGLVRAGPPEDACLDSHWLSVWLSRRADLRITSESGALRQLTARAGMRSDDDDQVHVLLGIAEPPGAGRGHWSCNPRKVHQAHPRPTAQHWKAAGPAGMSGNAAPSTSAS